MASTDDPTPKQWLNQVLAQAPTLIRSGLSNKWTEDEILAMNIIRMVSAMLANPSRESSSILGKVSDVLYASPPGLMARRARCVGAVRGAGEAWLTATNEEARKGIVAALVWNLSLEDPKLREACANDIVRASLAARLERYDPSPARKQGRAGAETILAEILVYEADDGALGYPGTDRKDPTDAVAELSKALGNAVSKTFPLHDPASK